MQLAIYTYPNVKSVRENTIAVNLKAHERHTNVERRQCVHCICAALS